MKNAVLFFAACLFISAVSSGCKKEQHQGSTTTSTLVLKPSNNPNEASLGIWDGADWTNPTSVEEPLTAWTKNGAPTTQRGLLKFDLSALPANATIQSATLYLYSDPTPLNGNLTDANYGADNAMVIQQVGTLWSAQTVNWFNQPAGLSTNQVIIPSTLASFLDIQADVTPIVKSMLQNDANYGFKTMLQDETEYTSRIFVSSYGSDTSRHPTLIVSYQHVTTQ